MPLPKAKTNPFYSYSFLIFIIRFFPSLAAMAVTVWYSRVLPAATYGDYQHVWIQLNVFYPLICFGLQALMMTYTPAALVAMARRIGRRSYIAYTGWALIPAVAFAWMQCREVHVGFLLSLLFVMAFAVSAILEAFLVVARRFRVLVSVNVIYSIAYVAIHGGVLQSGFSLRSIFTLLTILVAARLLIYTVTAVRAFKTTAQQNADVPARSQVRHLWVHLGIYDITQVLSNYADKFVISLLLPAGLSAVYFNGSQNIPFLPILFNAAASAVLMQLSALAADGQNEHIVALVNRLGRVMSAIVFPLFFFLLAYRQEVVIGLLSGKYAAAVPIFAASLLVLPLRAYSFTTVLQRLHKGALINIGAATELVVGALLMYPLYLWIGLPGVALAFVISTYLQAAFYLYHSSRLLGVPVLHLLPWADWAIKLIVFSLLIIGTRVVSTRLYNGNIPLFLGVSVMLASMAAALWLAYRKDRTHGNAHT